jgi:hypothetical protein
LQSLPGIARSLDAENIREANTACYISN